MTYSRRYSGRMLIQAALDETAAGPLGAGGLRGAVVLKPGTYEIAGTLTIGARGVALRGSGSGDSGTIVRLAGAPH
jgi:hypothetical protein